MTSTRTKAAAFILAGGIILAGCGASKTATPTPAPPPAPAATTKPVDVKLEAFVLTVKSRLPNLPRAEAISLGKTICDTIDSFGTVQATFVAIASDPRFKGMYEDVGFITGAAVPTFCPKYEAEVNRLAK